MKKVSKELNIEKEKIMFTTLFTRENSYKEDFEYLQNNLLGLNQFEYISKEIRPDLIISLNDVGPVIKQWKFAKKYNLEIIPYITTDIDDIGEKNEFLKYNFKKIITPSQHSKNNIQKYINIPTYILPHLMHNKFKELKSKEEIKLKWFGRKDLFVITAVNRNNTRKRWDILIDIFNEFSKDKEDVILIIKSNKLDNTERYSTIYAPQYNLNKLVKNNNKIKLITDYLDMDQLNEIYNIGDIGFSTTSGEGFGLTSCEMTMCKVPQIVPNNTSHKWLFGENYEGLIETEQYPYQIARSCL